MSFAAMSIAQLASLMANASDVEQRRLLFAEFLEEFKHESRAARQRLISEEPASTGHPEWDALLAGLAEHLATAESLTSPVWVDRENRFLADPWCYFDLPYFRAEAERETPESFARRGVLIRAVELERV